jgi:hypothetical protein
VLGDDEIHEVDQVRHGHVSRQEHENERRLGALLQRHRQDVALHEEGGGEKCHAGNGRHVHEEVHGVELLRVGGEKDALQEREDC